MPKVELIKPRRALIAIKHHPRLRHRAAFRRARRQHAMMN
jgi:hypothetical protein